MKLNTGYKQTDLGTIPIDWNVDFVKNHAKIRTGAKNTQNKVEDGDYPFFVRSNIVERINTYAFDGEAVLTAGDGVGTGKVFHYFNGKFDFHQRVYLISNFSDKLDGYFFYLYFSSHFYDRIKSMTAKSSVDSVRMDMITNMIITLPPLPEQHAIAAAFSDVDALLASLDALIAKKRAIKQGAMQELLTGKTRLPGFSQKHDYKKTEIGIIPVDWNVRLFGDMVSIRNSKVDPRISHTSYFCVELEDVGQDDGKLIGSTETGKTSSIKNRFQKGDVLFGKLRAYLRKYWLADRDGVCTTEIWPLIANQHTLISNYLFYLVRTDGFINEASIAYGTHMPRTDWNVIKNYKVALPSIPEQHVISAVLADMDSEIQALEQQREKTRLLKQGMMQELLTGKTRLNIE